MEILMICVEIVLLGLLVYGAFMVAVLIVAILNSIYETFIKKLFHKRNI